MTLRSYLNYFKIIFSVTFGEKGRLAQVPLFSRSRWCFACYTFKSSTCENVLRPESQHALFPWCFACYIFVEQVFPSLSTFCVAFWVRFFGLSWGFLSPFFLQLFWRAGSNPN